MLALSRKFTLKNLTECISDIFQHENSHKGLCQIRPALCTAVKIQIWIWVIFHLPLLAYLIKTKQQINVY